MYDVMTLYLYGWQNTCIYEVNSHILQYPLIVVIQEFNSFRNTRIQHQYLVQAAAVLYTRAIKVCGLPQSSYTTYHKYSIKQKSLMILSPSEAIQHTPWQFITAVLDSSEEIGSCRQARLLNCCMMIISSDDA